MGKCLRCVESAASRRGWRVRDTPPPSKLNLDLQIEFEMSGTKFEIWVNVCVLRERRGRVCECG